MELRYLVRTGLKVSALCLGWQLSGEEMAQLNRVSNPSLPYPHDFFSRYGIPWR